MMPTPRDMIEVTAARPVPARRRTASISLLFALTIAFLVAVPLAIVVVINVRANSENTFALLNQRTLLLVDAIESGVRRHLDDASDAVEFMARQYSDGAVDLTARDAARAHLRGAISALPNVEALVVFSHGEFRAGVFRQPSGEFGDIPTWGAESDQVRIAALRAIAEGTLGWGELVFRRGQVYANYAAPLTSDTGTEGIVVAAVSITTLSKIISEISNRFNTTAFILDGGDRVLAHPNLASSHPEVTAASPTVPLTRIGDPIVAAFHQRETIEEFDDAAAGGVEVSSIEIGDQDYILISRTLEGYGPRPWTIGAYFTAEEVGNEINRLVTVAAVSLGALLASLTLAFLIARLMSRPIRRFAAQAALITNLDLDKVAPLPRSRIRELDNGAAAFNAMLDGLRAFAAYVPRTLVTRLVHSGVKETTQSVERELTIMFTDIVGFTSLAERLTAGETAHLLNHHFRILTRIVEATDGTVDKFMGDGLLAFWGAPERIENHAEAACRSALEIAAALHDDNVRRAAEGGSQIKLRIGLHTGPVIVGNVGGGGRINYTVVGDAVNVCQRLQDLGREVGPDAETVILLSAETADRAGPGFVTEPVSVHLLRGRRTPVEARRLLAGPAQEQG